MAEVIIDLKEFDEIRDKANKYDDLMLTNKASSRDTHKVLSMHLKALLAKSIEMINTSRGNKETVLFENFRLEADLNNPFIKDITVIIDPSPERNGFYNARLAYHYER